MSIESHLTRRQAVQAAGALGVAGATYLVLPPWLGDLLGSGAAQAATACTKLTPGLDRGSILGQHDAASLRHPR